MVTMLKQIIITYWQVLCFQRSPEDTPSSTMMSGIALCLALAAAILQYQLASFLTTGTASTLLILLITLVQVSLFAAYGRLVLWSNNASHHFFRLMTCWLMMLFFLDVISSLVMGLLLGVGHMGTGQTLAQFTQTLGLAFGIVFSIWQVTFIVQLYRVLTRQNFLLALLIYIGWLGVNYLFLLMIKSV